MTAKEKVLSVYPMAYCKCLQSSVKFGVGLYAIYLKNGTIISQILNTKPTAWGSALNTIQKQGLI